MKILSTLILLVLTLSSFAQNYCGFDAYRDHLCQEPHYSDQVDQQDELIRARVYENTMLGGGQIYTIPVVVHVIHNGGGENISDETVENAIEWLNDAFANEGFYAFDDGVDTQIRFCQAHVDPDGEFHSGVNHVQSELTEVTIPTQDQELKDLIRWDTEKYMNVWVVGSLIREVDQEAIVGNSTLPASHGMDNDGIIIEAAYMGGTENQNKVLVHEAGHYLGLYHTFQGGCANDDCTSDGDQVCDTPPDGLGSGLCTEINSCASDEDDLSENNPFRPVDLGGLGDQDDMVENYMDYSNLPCYERFSFGQANRMVAALIDIRATLLEEDRCNAPCEMPITADVTASANQIFLGDEVQFINFSENATGAEWYIDEELVSETTNYLFEPTETGSYFIEVLLINDEQGCAVELEWVIEVICPVTALYTSSGDTPLPGDEVDFFNGSLDATSYAWFLDGELISDEMNISLSFDDFGSFEVCLSASNGECASVYCENFAVGTCNTGKENSNWLTYVDGPGLNAYSFITGDLVYGEVDVGYSEGKSTISDENGNLLFSSDCTKLLNTNLETTPNGNGLMGGFSARQGAMFVRDPGNELRYYLFTLDQNENNYQGGLRYHVIDRTLDGGLGDIDPGFKNVFLSQPMTETMTCVRHCNYIDFWVVVYNNALEQYESWLIDAGGVASDPVVTPYPENEISDLIYAEDIHVSPKGDRILHDQNLYEFDAGSGAISLITQFPFDFEIRSDFSPSGKYLYMQTGEITPVLRQLNLELEPDEMLDEQWTMTQAIFSIYSDMAATPNGEILCANPFGGTIDVIHNPNMFGDDINFEAGVQNNAGFVNGFGNYYHAYTGEQVYIEGPAEACQGETLNYDLYGCPDGMITWDISPAVPFAQLLDGSIEVQFTEPGNYSLSSALETECGVMVGSYQVQIGENPYPDLGPDMNICAGTSLVLSPGSGFESYLWSDGSEDDVLVIDEPGTYSVTVEESGGCTITETIVIGQEITPVIDLGADVDICEEVLILDAGDDFLDYAWQDGWVGSQYTVFEAGTYWVEVTLPCAASDTIVISNCHGDGVDEQWLNLNVNLYPNPTSDILYAQWDENWTGQVTLIDAVGRTVWSHQLVNALSLNLDVSVFAAGSYHFVMRDDSGSFRQKVLLQ